MYGLTWPMTNYDADVHQRSLLPFIQFLCHASPLRWVYRMDPRWLSWCTVSYGLLSSLQSFITCRSWRTVCEYVSKGMATGVTHDIGDQGRAHIPRRPFSVSFASSQPVYSPRNIQRLFAFRFVVSKSAVYGSLPADESSLSLITGPLEDEIS